MNEGDHLAIANAIAAYCQAYDDHDRAGLEDVLHQDCSIELDGGRFDGQTYTGRRSIVDWLVDTWPVTPPCLHLTGNIHLAERGHEVEGRTDYLLFVRGDEGFEIRGRGRYIDTFRRQGDRWLLASRTVWQPR